MRSYAPEQLHTVGLFGHIGCGKTTLTEALLFTARAIPRMGRVEDGTTVSDYDPDEQQRGMSINLAVAPLEWNQHKINLIDTPGYADFLGDVASALRVIDGAIIVIDASGGVEVGTERVWNLARQANVPRILFINKLDRDNANFYRCIEQAREHLDGAVTPMQIPIGSARDFRGIISLCQQVAWLTSDQPDGRCVESAVPADLNEEMHRWRTELIDKIAATNDHLIERYFEGGEDALTPEELREGLRAGIADGSIVPVFCGSALQLAGVAQLLHGILDSVPTAARKQFAAVGTSNGTQTRFAPERTGPLAAFVFKTLADPYGRISYLRIYSGELASGATVVNTRTGKDERSLHLFAPLGKELNAVAVAGPGDIVLATRLADTLTNDTLGTADQPLQLAPIIFPRPAFTAVVKPHGRSDLDKLGAALAHAQEEDPTLQIGRDSETGEAQLAGLGESHLAIIAERMRHKFHVHVDVDLPRVPYREGIRTTASASYRHKKQSGGAGQFADVSLRVEPLPPDPDRTDPLEFVNEIVGGVISRGFMPAIEKGIREAMAEGVRIGSPLIGVRVAVVDGKEHPVDSKEIAFKTAGAHAFKLAALQATPVVTEPIYILEITIPEEYAGDVMSDISMRRGRVLGVLPADQGKLAIAAQVPLAECQRYATDLRAISHGRGSFTMSFDHYEDVPPHLIDSLVEEQTEAHALAH